MGRMGAKKVFVTVGTTKFDKLIDTVSSNEILDVLVSLGYDSVQFQVGPNSVYSVGIKQPEQQLNRKIRLKYDTYFDNFVEQVKQSDLVISHAGAGTCVEVLAQKKPLIVVINSELMDNHQTELAEQLAKLGHLQVSATASDLRRVLLENKFNDFKPYPPANGQLFSNYLDKCMGFI